MLATGGEVWMGDETTLREMPPLRGAWAKRGEQAVVVISGRNSRRVLHGALNVRTGEQVHIVRESSRPNDPIAFLHALGKHTPGCPTIPILEHAPQQHPKRVQQAATDAGIEIVWLPFRSPELNPCEDLWLHLKASVAANRVYEQVADLAASASSWLCALTPAQVFKRSGLASAKFQWLPT